MVHPLQRASSTFKQRRRRRYNFVIVRAAAAAAATSYTAYTKTSQLWIVNEIIQFDR